VGALLDASAVPAGRTASAHLHAVARSNGIGLRRVGEVLEMTGLAAAARRRAGGFSLGMKQRLGIALALLGDPPVLMFDEPVNGLDPEGVHWVRERFRSLAAEGRTVFVSSHLMSEMALTADRLIVIGRGKLIADTTVDKLTESSGRGDVLVRSPREREFGELLAAHGAVVTAVGDGRVSVTGMDAAAVGDLAAAHGIAVHELIPRHASLEEAFMDITGDSVEYRARLERPEAGERTSG
jgi:ABC-2 type transport system ATP-binding protein